MPTCQYKHLPVNYTDAGKGPAVVLVHGFLENLTMWNDFSAELSKRYRVVCIDLLGHGKTPNLGYVHTMEEYAEAVKAVLDFLRLRKYAVIGHSMGGYVALALAEKFPDNIRALGLFYSTAKADDEEKQQFRLRAIEAVKHNYKTFVRTSVPALFTDASQKTYTKEVAALVNDALQMDAQSIAAALEGMRVRKDREALLSYGPYPVFIASSKNDPRINFAEMQSQLTAKNVVQTLITANGHMGHIEDKDECLAFLKQALQKTR